MKAKIFLSVTAYHTHEHTHTHTHAHTLPTEQRTNAHNTFYEPLTAIVALQVVEDKQKWLSPVTTDIAYIAFHYILCWKKAKKFLSMALNASRLTSAEHVKVKGKDETPHISFHPRLLYCKNNERPPQLPVNQCWRAIRLTESEDLPLHDTKRIAFQQWLLRKS